ncbi:MAG: MBL fold metallo-hydrolase [Alphaproteobacteria bacterium]|nr:MAG: MBL fold metallo-hydrolase [Alphaproteobacteria bacterium]
MAIKFNQTFECEYGVMEEIAPGVRRLMARNPGAFTFYGTGVFIIGEGDVAVIDPGPLLDAHVDALLTGLKNESVSHILITHTHNDHSPAAAPLKAATSAKTYAFGPHGAGKEAEGVKVEEGGDMDFAPDVEIRHGDVIEGKGWSFDCVYTPGHTSNHMCFGHRESATLYTGDHVMGWSTSVIVPPDGDMAAYFDSLDLLLTRDDMLYRPTHGPGIENTREHVSAFIEHRKTRERQITECLRRGTGDIRAMVQEMYKDVDPRLHAPAAMSVLAHLEHMVKTGRAKVDGPVSLDAHYWL